MRRLSQKENRVCSNQTRGTKDFALLVKWILHDATNVGVGVRFSQSAPKLVGVINRKVNSRRSRHLGRLCSDILRQYCNDIEKHWGKSPNWSMCNNLWKVMQVGWSAD